MIMQIFEELTQALMVLNKDNGMQLVKDLIDVIHSHKAKATPSAGAQ